MYALFVSCVGFVGGLLLLGGLLVGDGDLDLSASLEKIKECNMTLRIALLCFITLFLAVLHVVTSCYITLIN